MWWWVIWVLLGVVCWLWIGVGVLTAADDEDESLRRWLDECPSPNLRLLVLLAWPWVLCEFRRRN